MAKKVHDSVLDGALNIIKNNCNKMTVCTSEPSNFAAANNGGASFLADVNMSSGDFTVSNGDTSGRKVEVASKSDVNVDTTGNAQHVALLDTSSSTLLYVTTCTAQQLTSGNTVTFPAWDIEIADPS